MKMNMKVFKSLTTEPRLVQTIGDREVGIYFMEDTPYHAQFLNKGRMSAWTSDGKEFKLLVDEGFFNASGKFFDETVNGYWIELLTDAGKITKRFQMMMLYPALLLLILVGIITGIWFQAHSRNILLISVILLFVVQVFQSRLINKKFGELQAEVQTKIYDYLGKDEVSKIVNAQDKYVKEYYNIEEDDVLEESELEDNQDVIEVEVNEDVKDEEMSDE